MADYFAKSVDREASKAFKKVKYDIEELKRLVQTKQDKQYNVLSEMNKMKSELKIEFREELLDLQKTMQKEVDALRKEVLYYRELCEQNRYEHHKVKVVEHHKTHAHSHISTQNTSNVHSVQQQPQNQHHNASNEEFHYRRIIQEEQDFKPTPQVEEFDETTAKKKTYLKWITVGDSDLDSIDEVYTR